jgi:hypothetical protein
MAEDEVDPRALVADDPAYELLITLRALRA